MIITLNNFIIYIEGIIMKENQIIDGKLELGEDTQIVFRKQFSKNGEQYFTSLKNDATTYFVFDLKSKDNQYSLDVYEVKKNDDDAKIVSATHHKITGAWMKGHLAVMTEVLANKKDNIGIIFHPDNNTMGDVLKGEAVVGKKLQAPLMDFLDKTIGVKNLVLHNDPHVLKAVFPPAIKHEIVEDREESLINGIKVLAQDGYKLGDNPLVEKRFNLPKDKEDNISEIQKKYFGELIKLQFKDEKVITDKNLKQNTVSYKIAQMRQKLEDQGIKLKLK